MVFIGCFQSLSDRLGCLFETYRPSLNTHRNPLSACHGCSWKPCWWGCTFFPKIMNSAIASFEAEALRMKKWRHYGMATSRDPPAGAPGENHFLDRLGQLSEDHSWWCTGVCFHFLCFKMVHCKVVSLLSLRRDRSTIVYRSYCKPQSLSRSPPSVGQSSCFLGTPPPRIIPFHKSTVFWFFSYPCGNS